MNILFGFKNGKERTFSINKEYGERLRLTLYNGTEKIGAIDSFSFKTTSCPSDYVSINGKEVEFIKIWEL
jgi:hypothetical protein